MNHKMNLIVLFCALFCGYQGMAQTKNYTKKDTISVEVVDSTKIEGATSAKAGKNDRNVLLNAQDNSKPRDVNIGLPASVGGITILENDLPSVYFFWPELPTQTWRSSTGLSGMGLVKMDEMAMTMGELGFAVNSYTREGTDKFQFNAKLSGDAYGWMNQDFAISGPLSKKSKWSYMVSAYNNMDPNSIDLMFTDYSDRTQLYRVGITKWFNNHKGRITFAYKFGKSFSLTNYGLFRYGKDGKAEELDNFKVGTDSYIVRDGQLRVLDVKSGNYKWVDLGNSDQVSTPSHQFDVFGNLQLNNGWNFKYTTRLYKAKSTLTYAVPISGYATTVSADDGYTIASTGEAYSGDVIQGLTMYTPKTPITSSLTRLSLNKKTLKHDMTVGLTEFYYHINKFTSDRSYYYQTVEANPQRLVYTDPSGDNSTDEYGFYGYNIGSEYHNGHENKIALYFTDNWKVNDRLGINYGIQLRHHTTKGNYSLTARTTGVTLADMDLTDIDLSFTNVSGSIKATYSLTKDFGVTANALLQQEDGRLENYSGAYDPDPKVRNAKLGAFGVYFNSKYLSLVSQFTYLTRDRYLTRLNVTNPDDATDQDVASVNYDIHTMGWTTDMVLTPFKGFRMHYLLTIQSPKYKKFDFTEFGYDYNYSNNYVTKVSKVLMEIDPSYSFNKFRVWVSLRYFGKQYAAISNALFFAARWETFGGVNYTINKHFSAGLSVVNFLNQRGPQGEINGANLATGAEAEKYYDQITTATYINPMNLKASLTFNF